MEKLTVPRTIDLLREIVEERGSDYVYPGQPARSDVPGVLCYYVNADGTPGCIVAQVLHRNGTTLQQLAKHEGETPFSEPFVSAFGLTFDVSNILKAAQGIQDDGYTWGAALAAAEDVASDIGPDS